MQDKVDGEENARLGEKNSKLVERFLGNLKKNGRERIKNQEKTLKEG